ncbi:GSU3473 family protein [Geopsychrobacter electrodiphilus]|uniref:GSU3473 family protein n=1 Tax=Geopsychrobacter electrodiphilus TaxID=225196 RepID=UPI00316AE540
MRVIYTDGTFDLVKDFSLNRLIETCRIIKFKRESGWVDIRSQQIRRKGRDENYFGPERRSHPQPGP